MNTQQLRLLRLEESRWRAVRKAVAKPCDDAARHALYRAAIGRDKSSKDFSNRDLTAVLAKLRAESDPANFDAQMHAQCDDGERKARYESECYAVMGRMVECGGKDFAGPDAMARYLNGTAWAICKAPVKALTAEQMRVVLGALERSLKRMSPAPAYVPPAPAEDVPF
ncbi:hypothetical protein OPIT5_08190 [Opitutaceae bacterium TAV5]|nr:hypothetical protein OPIT5_08190 [Opitutaceae bacterium TAV5]